MSVVEKLEEAIKNRPEIRRFCNGRCSLTKEEMQHLIDWVKHLEALFVAFKKDYDRQIHVPRKKLEDRAKSGFEVWQATVDMTHSELPENHNAAELSAKIKEVRERKIWVKIPELLGVEKTK